MLTRNTRRGFTLVEILIVVVILGVLAAIVVPLFAGTSVDARRAALVQQLGTLRSQIQLFIVQHGQTPSISGADWGDLTQPSVADGVQIAAYLAHVPSNMVNGFSDIAVVDTDPTFGSAVAGDSIGFVYNSITGGIWATNSQGNKIFDESQLNNPAN